MGSITGGLFVAISRRKSMMVFSVVGILGCVLSCVPQMVVLCLGRFVYGYSAGVMLIASSKMLSEIIPASVMDNGYGVSTNLSISLFKAFVFLFGQWVPKDH